MKKLLALFLLTFACLHGQETIDLGPHGKLTLYLLGDWKVDDRSMANDRTIVIKPKKDSANVICKIEVTFPDVDRYSRKDKLKLQVEADCRGYEEQSVEGKAYAKEFRLGIPGGFGFYCSFTDASLRSGPSTKADDYRVVSAGKIRVSPNVLLDVFIGADAFRSEAYQQLLGAIEGMEYTPAR